jgi:hypothetical protein
MKRKLINSEVIAIRKPRNGKENTIVNRILKENLNKQSGTFLLSRTRRLALMKAFQEREKFATRNHNDTMAGIFRFFREKVAGLDRLFNGQANERRKGHQSKQRTGTRIHWTTMITIVGFALFGPGGLLGLHLEFGRRVFNWLRGALGKQRGENRRHWNLYKALTRLKLGEIFLMMGTMITNFGTWLRRVPQMLANALTSGANWLYQAGRKLVNRFIKGMKDRIKAALGQGKKTSQESRKGYKQGTKGNKKAGKKASKDIQKGFKEGGKGAKKSGKSQGGKTGKGFREGANKGQKKGGRTFAQRFIDSLKKRLGISSPSKVTTKIGTDTRRGFITGLNWKEVKKKTGEGLDDSIDLWKEKLRKFQKWLRQRPKEWGRLLKLNAHYMGSAGIFLAKTLIGAVKMRLGIKSPSKQFENIGKQMIMGLIAGLGKKKLLEILSKHFGGWEAFAKHIMTTIQQNVGRGWDWLSEFMGTDAKVLLAALEAHFGVAMEGAGALAGVKLEVGSVEMMRAIAEWLIAQDPDSNSSISSLFRPGDPRQHGRGEAVDIAPGSDKIANLAAKIIGYAGNWGEDTKGGFGVLSTAFGQVLWKTMVGGNHWNHVHLGIKAISDFLRNLATAAPTGTGKVPAGSGHDLGPSAVWDALYSVAVQRWNDPQQMRDLHSQSELGCLGLVPANDKYPR